MPMGMVASPATYQRLIGSMLLLKPSARQQTRLLLRPIATGCGLPEPFKLLKQNC
jgi:hypothetical protein